MHISRFLTLSKPVRPENWEDKNLQEVFKLSQILLREPSIMQLYLLARWDLRNTEGVGQSTHLLSFQMELK